MFLLLLVLLNADLENQFKEFRDKAKVAMPGSEWSPIELTQGLPPERADIVIIGGGVMGWSIAYWLKRKLMSRDSLRVVVVEKDPTVSFAHSPEPHVVCLLRPCTVLRLLMISVVSWCVLSTARPPRCSLQEVFGSSSR